MNGENQPLATDDSVKFEKQPFEVDEDFKKITIVLEESIYLNLLLKI